ncbi:type IIL restriction-modification enzyme MmeI [Rhodoferax antarcticus]|uniref:Putative methylase n=1 Tax=Rhodoferax antarcticus ANT.BR TaxID=1111071 RepID=A0A1Q8YFF2_9BURK|nr:hypothetical protein RA876_09045 [Rhodoferax antarcticus]OLP06771.1 putative methylase [Rhodoferax antarcticus ANT.BR]
MPQIVIVCDFARFRVHHLSTGETVEFTLKDLHKHIKLFGFVAGYKVQTIQPQNPVNIKAAERMGKLHDALKASGYSGHALEVLLVRLLFCLFADDTGIFQPAQALRTFIEERTAHDGSDLGSRMAQLFQTLNTPDGAAGVGNAANKRSQALDEQVAAFPTSTASCLKNPCRWPTSPRPCAKPCWMPARWTGQPSARLFSAACSRASWTTRPAATWARTTRLRKTFSS